MIEGLKFSRTLFAMISFLLIGVHKILLLALVTVGLRNVSGCVYSHFNAKSINPDVYVFVDNKSKGSTKNT